MVDSSERTSAVAPKSLAPGIKEMLRSFTRKDPPTTRVWPVNAVILAELYRMDCPRTFTEAQWRRIQDMCIVAFFFMLRPGEYAATRSTDTQSVPFRMEHVYFLHKHDVNAINPTLASCNDSTIHHVGLRLNNQKNRAKGETITHKASQQQICPVRSLKRITYEIISNQGNHKTKLYEYHDPYSRLRNKFCTLYSSDLTAALRLAAARCQHLTGIP
ncbi:MAG: hypothetical protein ACRCT2_07560, partial [Plesiomonas shigelloides]